MATVQLVDLALAVTPSRQIVCIELYPALPIDVILRTKLREILLADCLTSAVVASSSVGTGTRGASPLHQEFGLVQ